MVIVLYITLVCYLPILESILPRTDFGPGIPDIGAVRFFTYLLILVFIIYWGVTKEVRIFHKWIVILAIFYMIVFASVSWSNYAYSGSTLPQLFDTVFVVLLLAVIAINLFRKAQNQELYIKHIIIASFLFSVISIYEMVTGILAGQEEIRTTGTFGNANSFAIFLVLTIPCILYGLEKHIISKRFGWMVSVFVVVGIMCTVSRKGIITMGLCFCVYSFLKKHYRRLAFLLVGFSLLAIVLSGVSLIGHRFEKKEFRMHLEGKWNMTRAGWKMFLTSPIIGLGYKGYYDKFGQYFPDIWSIRKYDAHNIFITALANYGLLGFMPFIGIFLYPLFLSAKALRKQNGLGANRDIKDLAVICISSIIPFIISGWFAGGLFYQQAIISSLYTNISLFFSTSA